MENLRYKYTINHRLWLVQFFVLLFFAIGFVGAVMIVASKSRYDLEINESEMLIRGVEGSVLTEVETYKELSRLVMLNDDVVAFLNAKKTDAGLANDAKYGVMNVMNISKNLDSVFIFRNDGVYMSTGRGNYDVNLTLMQGTNWQKQILDKNGGAVILINAGNAINRENGVPIITVARAINDINTQKKIGILLLNFSISAFDGISFEEGNSRLCIMSSDGLFLIGREEPSNFFDTSFLSNEIRHYNIKGSSMGMMSGLCIEDTPLVILCHTSVPQLSISKDYIYAVILILLAFMIGIILSREFVTEEITKPILALTQAMEKTKKTGWLETIEVKMPHNEMGILADSYNSMIDSLHKLISELIEKEKSIQSMELRVLQEQIKPHFLYNSMETISYMALSAGADDVHTALDRLGSFYRNFLSKGDKEIPLSREVKIIQDYLAIQKLRYGDIILDEYHIAEAVKDWKVPKLLLQPAVENSIYHGIRPSGEPGIIRITAFQKEEKLHVIVYDSGVGMSQDNIEKMLLPNHMNVSLQEEGKTNGFGLRGTIERVRYYCNREDVVFIRSEIGEYTEIEFVITKTQEG